MLGYPWLRGSLIPASIPSLHKPCWWIIDIYNTGKRKGRQIKEQLRLTGLEKTKQPTVVVQVSPSAVRHLDRLSSGSVFRQSALEERVSTENEGERIGFTGASNLGPVYYYYYYQHLGFASPRLVVFVFMPKLFLTDWDWQIDMVILYIRHSVV